MKHWLKFLAGTPKRALATLLTTFTVTALLFPSLARFLVERFASVLWPLVSLSIVVGIVGFAYYLIAGIKCGKWN